MVTLSPPSHSPSIGPLRRITVSRIFWHAVQDNFPGLHRQKGYPALFWYLIFGAWHDKETHRLLLPAKLLAHIEGRDDENTQAEQFLIRFRDDVLPPGAVFRWSKWSARDKKCRQLLAFSLGAFDKIVANEFQRHWHSKGRVYLNGTAYTVGRQRLLRREEQQASSQRAGLCEDAREIQEYLNSLAPNLFTRAISDNFDAASLVASRIPEANVVMEQRRLLRQIHSQPQPFYGASESGRTVRLWANEAIPNLKGDVRRALTRGWEDADLRCSQLAICASLWKLPDVQDFLARGTSFWTHVFDEMGVPTEQRGAVKGAIKDGVYAICYGMEEMHLPGQIALRLVKAGQEKELARRFLSVPLVAALLPARTKALAKITADGGAESPYGKWCAVDSTRDAASVMADIAQAWEMKLIVPAFRLARETNDFAITLYQFDGFSVHFTRRADTWRKRLTECVNEEAERWNIATTLEWDESTRPCRTTEAHTALSRPSASAPVLSYSLRPLMSPPLASSVLPPLPIISPTGRFYRGEVGRPVHKVAKDNHCGVN